MDWNGLEMGGGLGEQFISPTVNPHSVIPNGERVGKLCKAGQKGGG